MMEQPASPNDSALGHSAAGQRINRRPVGRTSLRFRLTLWVVAINTLIVGATAAVFWLYQRWSMDESLNDRRIRRTQMLAAELARAIPGGLDARLADLGDELGRQFIGEEFVLELYDSGSLLRGSTKPGGPEFGAAHVERVMRTGRPVVEQGYWPSDARHSDPDSVRTVAVPLTGTDGRPYAAVLTVTDRFTSAQQGLLRGVVVIALIIAPIASAVSGWYIAGIAVLPLEKLRQLASRLAPDSSDTIMTDNSLGATTEVIRLASEWDAARARVAERFAAQDRFLSNVSHEIKTPIAVMLTEAQTIDRSRLGPEAREFVDSVVEEMSRLGRLVESFLTLARIQDGKGLARFRPYAVNDLVMDSVDNCRRMADQHRIRLEPGLFTDDESFDLAVSGEPELLRTMLDNLIRNAVRFSPENGVVCVAPARDRDNPRLIAIAVEDEGAGIPAERLHTIFDRFAQAPNQPRQGRGHGLGLTIALGIAELHAGTITAENRRGGGCRFTVVLPIADAAEQTAAPRDTRQTRAAGIS